MRRPIPGRYLLGLAALVVVLGAPRAAAADRDYDLTVMVVRAGAGPSQVAVSYSHLVSRGALTVAVTDLGRATQARVRGVSIREEALYRGSKERGSSVEFEAEGLLRSGAPLPVEAFARLPEWRHMRVAFLLGPDFTFAGPTVGTVAGSSYRLVSQGATYEYDIDRTGRAGGGEAAGGAVPPAAAGGGQREQEAGGRKDGIKIVLIGIALLLLVLAVWLLSQSLRKETANPRG